MEVQNAEEHENEKTLEASVIENDKDAGKDVEAVVEAEPEKDENDAVETSTGGKRKEDEEFVENYSFRKKSRITMQKENQNVQLLHELVEEIFVRLPLKSIVRFKSLSKLWRLTIESRSFGERHFLKRFQNQLDQSIYTAKPAIHLFQQVCSPASLQRFIDNEKRREPNTQGYKLVVCSSISHGLLKFMCEVFDFRADTWRYVPYTTCYEIVGSPYYWKGALYWLTQPHLGSTILVAFDLHLLKETYANSVNYHFAFEFKAEIVRGGRMRVLPKHGTSFLLPLTLER